MNKRFLSLMVVAGLSVSGLLAQPVFASDADPVLVKYQGIEVKKSDLENLINLEVPKDKRVQIWSNEQTLRQLIANLFITRELAHQARMDGVTKEDKWQREYFVDRSLLISQLKADVDKRMAKVDLEKVAKEDYLAHPELFIRPKQVEAAHILIGEKGRSDAEAKALAEKVLAEVKANPADFAKLADKYSDDPSVKTNHGNLGYFGEKDMVEPFAKAAFGMTQKGEIVGPIKSQFGYHIIMLEGTRPATTLPFAEVKDKLMEQEKAKLTNQFREDAITVVKSLKGIETNETAVKALVRPIPGFPPETLPAAQPEAKPAAPAK
ncbi:MAG: peptidylprolyl isomerase [Halothiobacillus sp.]